MVRRASRLFLETEAALNAAASPDDLEFTLTTAKATAVALPGTYGLKVNAP